MVSEGRAPPKMSGWFTMTLVQGHCEVISFHAPVCYPSSFSRSWSSLVSEASAQGLPGSYPWESDFV